MIQRKQTLYLLLSLGFLISMFVATMAYDEVERIRFTEVTPLLIFNTVSTLLTFVSIFLYRHRILQIRVSVFNTVILFGYQGWTIWLFFTRPENTIFTISGIFPVICAILTIMAIRLIAVDEATVRSISRLRK